jgi:hypothetical protein
MPYDLIGMIANISLALSLIVGLVFGVTQVRAAARDRRERLTIDALRSFASREFAELMQYINAHDMPGTKAELDALPDQDQIMFIQWSQQMEDLGILVAEKIIDIDLVDKTLGSYVSTTWEKYKPMAESLRVEEREPFFNEYFQWLAEVIDERMRANPRKPYYESHGRSR